MQRIEFYSNQSQRKTLIDDALVLGESTIHDDFIDSNGNSTNGKSGRLTFDVKTSPPLTADQITVRAIVDKINNDQSLNNVEERDFRKLYHVGGIR